MTDGTKPEALKPCPFCGNDSAHLWHKHGAVQCLSCNAKAVDVVGWNQRPAPTDEEIRRMAAIVGPAVLKAVRDWDDNALDLRRESTVATTAAESAIREAVSGGRE